MVNSLLKAGREEAEAYQNAAYCEQTLQLTVKWKSVPITLPRPPFRDLQSITAILPDSTEQDVTSQFEVQNNGIRAELIRKPSNNIPAFSRLKIIYTAGYDVVPEKVKQAILLYATWAWMHRSGDEPIPAAFYALLTKGRAVPV